MRIIIISQRYVQPQKSPPGRRQDEAQPPELPLHHRDQLQRPHRQTTSRAPRDPPGEQQHEAPRGEEHAGLQGPGRDQVGVPEAVYERHERLDLRADRGHPRGAEDVREFPEGEEAVRQQLGRGRVRGEAVRSSGL